MGIIGPEVSNRVSKHPAHAAYWSRLGRWPGRFLICLLVM